jgi:hypothetical protein
VDHDGTRASLGNVRTGDGQTPRGSESRTQGSDVQRTADKTGTKPSADERKLGAPDPPGSGTKNETWKEGAAAKSPEGRKPEAPKSSLPEQIIGVMAQSKDLNDLKLKLGLGPVTDEALAGYLSKKGFAPAPDDHNAAPYHLFPRHPGITD